MTEWQVFVCDSAGERVAQLDEYENATIVARFNSVGSWKLTATNTAAARALTAERAGIEFVRDGAVVMTGPVESKVRKFNSSFDGYEFTGSDDNVWLRRRLAHPEPLTASPPYNTDDYDVRTGTASTIILEYVDENAGPGALADRQVEGLDLGADPTAGGTITGRARWQNLLDFIGDLAAASGLGFRTRKVLDTPDVAGDPRTFQVYEPVDRSASVKFSVELGNLAAFTYSETAPNLNYLYVLGSGEGTARVVVEDDSADSVTAWGRIESAQDRRDTADTGELAQAASATLAENATKVGFSLTPIETDSIRYGVSYDLGDLVTVIVDGLSTVDVVREVVLTLDGAGETVTPTVGDPQASTQRPRIFDQVARLAKRVRELERI